MDLTPTPSQTAGPFLHLGLTDTRSVTQVAADGATGERLWLTFRLLDGDSLPVPDAMIELWQADSEGNYNGGTLSGFGRLATSDDGTCNKLEAPHINVSVFARGLLKRLSTRVYFAGDPANSEDSVLALVPEQRRATLFARPDPNRDRGWIQEIRMRGEGETVFFDV